MTDNLNQLAFKYFNGTITGEEEALLFQGIQTEEGLKEFREAERQWMEDPETLSQTEIPWKELKSRLAIFDSSKSIVPKKPQRVNFWIFTTIAACIAVAVMGLFLLRPVEPASFAFEAPAGSRSKVVLPDSSIVWLNSGSRLYFTNNYGEENRELHLSGEGYFEVFRNEKMPFVVHAGLCDITVLGTRFNVSSYENDNIISTSVSEGKVRISDGKQAISVSKGQIVEYSKNTSSFTKKSISASSIAAWTENRLEYADITLRDFADIVSRYYNVQIVIKSEKNANEHLNISLRNNETLDEVLEGISRVLPVAIQRQGNTIYLQ